ncbi:hypothetical protein JHS3_21900 [Jeongeupia sp. HS-3]|uniref:hypothetical protein n=1 Tax=Jeongeupia sp. HS-3 TaxID=1009682 RepID=UPI0018A33C1D|nr:hypothetical protein [Jeongeupia sp. HS-3]BCL76454.1 hypothetical protein JHS3_21900 [Jeongeupia sp. HS-3]
MRFAALLLVAVAGSAFAQRMLPPAGQLGELDAYSPMRSVKIDGEVYHAAPGLRIYNATGALLTPQQVLQAPKSAKIWYQIERNTGFAWRIWFLGDEEYANLKQRFAKPAFVTASEPQLLQ